MRLFIVKIYRTVPLVQLLVKDTHPLHYSWFTKPVYLVIKKSQYLLFWIKKLWKVILRSNHLKGYRNGTHGMSFLRLTLGFRKAIITLEAVLVNWAKCSGSSKMKTSLVNTVWLYSALRSAQNKSNSVNFIWDNSIWVINLNRSTSYEIILYE